MNNNLCKRWLLLPKSNAHIIWTLRINWIETNENSKKLVIQLMRKLIIDSLLEPKRLFVKRLLLSMDLLKLKIWSSRQSNLNSSLIVKNYIIISNKNLIWSMRTLRKTKQKLIQSVKKYKISNKLCKMVCKKNSKMWEQ